jgi:hypothetical protein
MAEVPSLTRLVFLVLFSSLSRTIQGRLSCPELAVTPETPNA